MELFNTKIYYIGSWNWYQCWFSLSTPKIQWFLSFIKLGIKKITKLDFSIKIELQNYWGIEYV
jgi:hypothetical protein